MTFVFVLVFSLLTQGLYTGTAPYPMFVLLGQVIWTLFAQGTLQGGNGILLRAGLVKKIYFPREYVCLAYILTILVTTAVNLIVFGALFAFYGLVPTWPALLFPLILGILLLIVVGISLLLAAIFIRVEDLRYLWQLIIAIGLFASPVVYEASVVPPQYAVWYGFNPMVGILTASRDVLIYGVWPSVWSLAYPTFLGFFLFFVGLYVFRRSEHLFAERM
jgi:lipopolysaccharide transport system permease protein